MTTQPSFHCIANIGDATPLLHGGAFVLVDKRGCYDPELLIFEPGGSDRYGDPTSWKRFTILCERLTAIKGQEGEYIALSDNPFHVDHPAWFGTEKDLQSLASFIGTSVQELVLEATSSNPVHRATFYKSAVEYHGHGNFEAEPRKMNKKEARAWHDGWIIE